MSKRTYECKECGFAFPEELNDLIEGKTKVYCEKCGSPFGLEGVQLKRQAYPWAKTQKKKEADVSGLNKAIKTLDKVSSIP